VRAFNTIFVSLLQSYREHIDLPSVTPAPDSKSGTFSKSPAMGLASAASPVAKAISQLDLRVVGDYFENESPADGGGGGGGSGGEVGFDVRGGRRWKEGGNQRRNKSSPRHSLESFETSSASSGGGGKNLLSEPVFHLSDCSETDLTGGRKPSKEGQAEAVEAAATSQGGPSNKESAGAAAGGGGGDRHAEASGEGVQPATASREEVVPGTPEAAGKEGREGQKGRARRNAEKSPSGGSGPPPVIETNVQVAKRGGLLLEEEQDLEHIFNQETFLEATAPSKLEFLKNFLSTQMFTNFIQERVDMQREDCFDQLIFDRLQRRSRRYEKYMRKSKSGLLWESGGGKFSSWKER